jgi:hypothetical protein
MADDGRCRCRSGTLRADSDQALRACLSDVGDQGSYRCAPSSQGTSSNPACPSDSVGIFTYLLSTSTGQGAFIDFSAPTKSALQAHKADADKMINSLG